METPERQSSKASVAALNPSRTQEPGVVVQPTLLTPGAHIASLYI